MQKKILYYTLFSFFLSQCVKDAFNPGNAIENPFSTTNHLKDFSHYTGKSQKILTIPSLDDKLPKIGYVQLTSDNKIFCLSKIIGAGEKSSKGGGMDIAFLGSEYDKFKFPVINTGLGSKFDIDIKDTTVKLGNETELNTKMLPFSYINPNLGIAQIFGIETKFDPKSLAFCE